MSTSFNIGVKVGSFLRNLFSPYEPTRIEPTLLPEKSDEPSGIDLFTFEPEPVRDRKYYENEIKKVIDYQSTFMDQLTMAYITSHPALVEDMPEHFVKCIRAIYRNNEYLEEMVRELENVDLKKIEDEGFPEVTELLSKIKKEVK
jgi:hypothetical protein